ncbi:MAG TPA: uroporphyrinogen decarboxylase family protein, partial [Spirochaetia bacterium]|nr:uroporphyrinogen decarboxylase family protein [Spirochaetia bacterium]
MNDKERFHAIMSFEKPDRVLYWEQGFWGGTVERWYSEGMPRKHGVQGNPAYGDTVRGPATATGPGGKVCMDIFEAAGLDKPALQVPVELYLSPPFEEEVLEEHGDRLRVRDAMGIEKYITRQKDSIPHFVSWPVENRADFERLAAERLNPDSPERFPPDWKEHVKRLNAYDGVVGLGGHPCGFFGSARFLMGEVALLMGFLDQPELVHRIMDHLTDLWVSLYSRLLEEVMVDALYIWEDMSYKNGPLISPELFQKFMVPAYRKITDTVRSHGVKVVLLDTDGDCTKLIPGFLEGGVTGLYPFEVQAGMDVR